LDKRTDFAETGQVKRNRDSLHKDSGYLFISSGESMACNCGENTEHSKHLQPEVWFELLYLCIMHCWCLCVGVFAAAGPKTIWKKQLSCDEHEAHVYRSLMHDSLSQFIPRLYREVEYNGSGILLA